MATARAIRAIIPHVPKIKFPQRTAKADLSFKNVTPVAAPVSKTSPSPSSSAPIGSTPHGSGMDSLPQRYHRQLISEEEMEYIQRGGPA